MHGRRKGAWVSGMWVKLDALPQLACGACPLLSDDRECSIECGRHGQFQISWPQPSHPGIAENRAAGHTSLRAIAAELTRRGMRTRRVGKRGWGMSDA